MQYVEYETSRVPSTTYNHVNWSVALTRGTGLKYDGFYTLLNSQITEIHNRICMF